MRTSSGVVDLVVPPRCPGCGRAGHCAWCPSCVEAAERLALVDLGCARLAPSVLAVGVYAYAGVVAATIRAVKVRGAVAASAGLGELMRARLRLPAPGADLAVTWVPSTPRRRRRRGAEIPQLLAGPGARPLLWRVRDRPDQTTLDPAARRASPAGVFRAAARPPRGVVLVDDVRTTGATATAAAEALLAAGARRVLVATFAVGGQAARAATAPSSLAGRVGVAPRR